MQNYPTLASAAIKDIADVLRFIIRARTQDIMDFNNLTSILIRGRKVAKVPSDSADVDATDRVGDINYDPDYLYLCVDDSGAAWRRVALSTW